MSAKTISNKDLEQIRERAKEDAGRTDRRVLLAEVDRLTDAVAEVERWLETERKASREIDGFRAAWEDRARWAESERDIRERQRDQSIERAEKAERQARDWERACAIRADQARGYRMAAERSERERDEAQAKVERVYGLMRIPNRLDGVSNEALTQALAEPQPHAIRPHRTL